VNEPGADERRMQHILKERGIGFDAPSTPPAERPRDWLDELLDENAPAPVDETVEPEAEQTPVKPKKPQASKAQKTRKRKRRQPKHHTPDTPRSAWDNEASDPRQSLLDAWAAIPYRLKWLAYHLAAAAAGWKLGWVTWSTDTAAWFAAGHWLSVSAFVLYGLGVLAVGIYRRTRRWAWPVAWAAAIPVTSAIAGLLLYGSGYENLRIPL
jgi:hypothetical protein